ncbi:Na(+) H(+) antiporter subunit D [Polaromonas sp. CG9_12]|nr:Na(+) H(+) antiporter subunit D [Polaromonas sp. CG9_12]
MSAMRAIGALNEVIAPLMPHLMLAPVLLPLLTAALMLLMGEDKQRAKLTLNMASALLGLGVSVALLGWADQQGPASTMDVYLAGNWPAPYGIALALDRLSALMLVLTSTIALASSVFAAARWHRAGVHFHPLFQLQLMGLCGAFLTADLFNLFVFFEIMLAASYGLLLHGSGRVRVQSGLHFIAVNLAASSLFLIGASMLYGITGTLNMADLAQGIPQVAEADRGLLHAAAGILATAFLIKAAVWPLNFWLVPAYSAATAPVGALFALMTKVGIYVILRLWLLLFGVDAPGFDSSDPKTRTDFNEINHLAANFRNFCNGMICLYKCYLVFLFICVKVMACLSSSPAPAPTNTSNSSRRFVTTRAAPSNAPSPPLGGLTSWEANSSQ